MDTATDKEGNEKLGISITSKPKPYYYFSKETVSVVRSSLAIQNKLYFLENRGG